MREPRAPSSPLARRAAPAFLVPLLALAASCGALDAPAAAPTSPAPSVSENLFVNPGFEAGEQPWTFRDSADWLPFTVDDSLAHSGSHSARLDLPEEPERQRTRIAGAIQAIDPDVFPDYVSGFYRVERWDPDDVPFQYVQVVVAVRGADYADEFDLHEIRLPLAGIEREPFQLSNSHWLFVGRDQPHEGEWTYFGYPVKRAFELKWGRVPGAWESIDVFFEVRYDGKLVGQGAPAATVYFDDLYAGPQAANPNRPPEDAD